MTCPVVGMVSPSPSEPEDPDDAALAGMPSDVLVGVGRRAHVSRIIGADISREQEPVATDAGVDRYVLFTIRAAVGDRVAHDTGADLELGQELAGLRVHCLEPPVERAIERHVTGRDQRAAPIREMLFVLPYLLAGTRIPRHERAEVPPGTGMVGRARAD